MQKYNPSNDIFALKPDHALAVDRDDVACLFENNHRIGTTPDSQLQDWLAFLRTEHNIVSQYFPHQYKYYFTKL
jgi:hypothetical protein